MPRSTASAVENNFVRGRITEASGLNFPENACTEELNCNFEITGEVTRRLGFDVELPFSSRTIDREDRVISSFMWNNVGGDGGLIFYVVQIGARLYFYDRSESGSLSPSALLDTDIDLNDFKPGGAPDPDVEECQFTAGNGFLFVTHPTLNPFFVGWDPDTEEVYGVTIEIELRDFKGVDDSLAVDERPTSLSPEHTYNLTNQGWTISAYGVHNSSTSMTAATGSKVFTVTAGGPWASGQEIYIYSSGTAQQRGADNALHYMQGVVDTYSGTTLTVNVSGAGPDNATGAKTDWVITQGPDYIEQFSRGVGLYPSNADVWWLFKDANEAFYPARTMASVDRGTTPAPKGRNIYNINDDDATSYFRVRTCAFFAGRTFLGGIPYQDYSSNIYFSPIIRPNTTDEFGKCHQRNDPTSETLFDLLPNDGGVISIPEAGQIIKLWNLQSGLLVFAANGIWQITGSSGIGFTATDYSVNKISSIKALTSSSFIDVGGYPVWWSAEGIYTIQPADGGGFSVTVKSLTDETILTEYATIPLSCKYLARGAFNLITKKAHWLFRREARGSLHQNYEFDNVLIWNARTAAFNFWSIGEGVFVHDVLVTEGGTGITSIDGVITEADDTVIDEDSNIVISISQSSDVPTPVFKYLISFEQDDDTEFSFAETRSADYVDWGTFTEDNVGVDYISYFISGFKVHGKAQRKFQSNYLYIFSGEVPSQYNFQAIWDYANTGDSGSWGSQIHQSVVVTDTLYNIKRNRLKVRGEGLALQFKIFSTSGQPFKIVGWSSWETGNASI